jgi:hypothetical protein
MDNFDLRKYLVENKVTTNSRMMNENAASDEYNVTDEKRFYAISDEYIEPHTIDIGTWLKSKGESKEELEQDYDLENFYQVQEALGVEYDEIFTIDVGGTYVDYEFVYDLKDGNVAIMDDYSNGFVIVPMAAFEKFKQALIEK